MKSKTKIILSIFILLASLSFIFAADSTSISKVQYSQPTSFFASEFMTGITTTGITEEEFYDLQVFIPPLGCDPYVVRSDLLEEQNVPVFCKLVPLKVNPAVEITRIDSMNIKQVEANQYISGVGFHPAPTAIRGISRMGAPTSDNLGYVVVVLKKQPNEQAMPDNITAILSASLSYGSDYAYGIGQSEYYLPLMSDTEFNNAYNEYSFANGLGYLRLENIETDRATISVYDTRYGGLRRIASQTIEKGKTSNDIYLWTSTGGKGIRITLKDLTVPKTYARIRVNGVQEFDVYQGQRFYNGKCSVISINSIVGGTGNVKVRCGTETVTLEKGFNDVNLMIKGSPLNYKIGEKITDISTDKNDYYLAYFGSYADERGAKTFYIFIAELEKGLTEDNAKDRIDSITKDLGNQIRVKTADAIKKIEKSGTTNVYYADNFLEAKGVRFNQLITENALIENKNAENYYIKALDAYDFVKNNYGTESYISKDYSSYGEAALWKEYDLAKTFEQKEKEREILSRIMNTYPDSLHNEYKETAEMLFNKLDAYSSKGTSKYIEKEDISLELVSIKVPSEKDASVKLSVDNERKTLMEGDYIYNKDNKVITLSSFDENKIYVDYNCGEGKSKTKFAIQGFYNIADCGLKINVEEINLRKVVQIQVIPTARGKSRESNFTFSIGIEKRAKFLKLTPEQTNERIKKLNEQIAEIRNITEDLGEVIKAMKLGCLATSTAINIWNMFSGVSGEASARQKTMEYWNKHCQSREVQIQYNNAKDIDDCIAKASEDIEKDVLAMKEIMRRMNDNIKSADNIAKVSKEVDKDKVRLLHLVENLKTAIGITSLADIEQGYDNAKILSIVGGITSTAIASQDEVVQLTTLFEIIKGSSFIKDRIKTASKDAISLLKIIEEREKTIGNKEKDKREYGAEVIYQTGKNIENVRAKPVYYSELSGYSGATIDGNSRVVIYRYDTENLFLIVLDNPIPSSLKGGKTYPPKEIYKIVEDKKTLIKFTPDESFITTIFGDKSKKEIYNHLNSLRFIESTKSYKNKCTNCDYMEVFTLQPYRGKPAVLPFNCDEGWYVYVKQNFPGLGTGEKKSYLDSGVLNSYWICNVGEDGRMQPGVDTDCMRFDRYTGRELYDSEFPGLNKEETKNLILEATRAVELAESQFVKDPNTKTINIPRSHCPPLKVRNNEGNVGSRCTDFMSARQCQIIFNVCDPVVCPNSRCDFGGKYRVDNVIRSGIIGSTLLCLPNFIAFDKETGVLIPVCLTGINAGLDAWASILENYRDCLNESINNKSMTGICDTIHSFYMCDFWWRQAGPLAEAAFENLFLFLLGRTAGGRGGGEYLFVQDAWNNAERAMQFMQTTYGSESNLRFGFKDITTMLVGELCKAQASATYPNNFDSMLEPESPVQFHAWFEEVEYTSATTPPPRSHYKVFYHIYAGKERGHSYSVYLKSSPETLSYGTIYGKEYSYVATGYVAAGSYASDTKDLIDISGFKQLCVRIDLKEECGFKSVSTSAAINYLSDKIASAAATEEVTEESQCVNGGHNIGSFLTPNIQQAVEEFVNPELYNQGIIRVCSNKNPGEATNPARWKDVGYCTNTNIRCWLDMNSVKKAIKNLYVENMTLAEAEDINIKNLQEQGGYMDGEAARNKINELREIYLKKIAANVKNKGISYSVSGKTLDMLDSDAESLSKKIIFSRNRAELWMLVGEVYDAVARNLKTVVEKAVKEEEGAEAVPEEAKPKAIDTTLKAKPRLIFEFKDGKTTTNLFYGYSESLEWVWSPNKKKWYSATNPHGADSFWEGTITEKNAEFIKSLIGLDFSQGLKKFYDRTIKNQEGGWWGNAELSTDRVSLNYIGIITVKQPDATVLYFRFNAQNSSWEWSLDRQNWMDIGTTTVTKGRYSGQMPVQANQDIINSLKGKDLEEGLSIIFKMGNEYYVV